MKKALLLFLLLNVILFSQNVKITLLETSDVHGKIFPYDFVNEKETDHSLAAVKYYTDSLRNLKDQSTILLDNGDILQGSPAVYYYNYIDTVSPHLYAEVMNYIGYDVATIGNHDIEAGHAVYDRFREDLKFPWLAANAIDVSTGEPYFQPYQIIEKSGVKIAILGLITPGIPDWLPPNIWSGIDFEDMVTTARKWIPIIEGKENPDIIVGLFHSGVEYTYGGVKRETPRNENASLIVAEDVPGFDVVFVGHDHHGWNKFVTNSDGDSVLVIGTTASARDIAKVDVNFNKNNGKFTISGNIVNLRRAKMDEQYLSDFKPQFEKIKSFVDKKIGVLTEDICSGESVIQNATFTDLIHKIQLDISGADISLAAPLSMNTCLKAGDIKVAHLFDLYRYENLLYTMKLTGKEIKDYLEYAINLRYNSADSPHVFKFRMENGVPVLNKQGKASPENSFYNFDDAEGLDYIVDLDKPEGSRVKIKSFTNGNVFDENASYSVAVNSYRGSGGGGHLTKGAGIPKEELNNRITSSTDADLRFYMINYFEKYKTITPVVTQNWKLAPEDKVNQKIQEDKKLLFGTN